MTSRRTGVQYNSSPVSPLCEGLVQGWAGLPAGGGGGHREGGRREKWAEERQSKFKTESFLGLRTKKTRHSGGWHVYGKRVIDGIKTVPDVFRWHQ